MLVSAAIIVPDEAEFLDACLTSLDGFVDEIEGDTAYVTLKSRERKSGRARTSSTRAGEISDASK